MARRTPLPETTRRGWPALAAIVLTAVMLAGVGGELVARALGYPARPLVAAGAALAAVAVPLAVPTALLLRHGRRERRRLADELAQRSGIETELRRLAAADDLTGLHNRRFLTEFGAVMVDGAQRRGQPLALLLVDLDGFKGVNDRFGHRVGDEVLRAFADHLRRTLRAADVVARLGGDEFAAMLPETDPAGALRAAERIRARALDLPQLLGVTVSIGVATPAGPGARLETLLETADRALYEAKRLGRNRVVAAAAVQRPGPAETLEGRQTV